MQVTGYTSSHPVRHVDRGSCDSGRLTSVSLLELAGNPLVLRHVSCVLFCMHRGYATAIRLTLDYVTEWMVPCIAIFSM